MPRNRRISQAREDTPRPAKPDGGWRYFAILRQRRR
jgi:hypothetical protein